MEELSDDDLDKYIQDRYKNAIGYYLESSKTNKQWYKITRSLTVIFGALVTLIASLSSSRFIVGSAVEELFALGACPRIGSVARGRHFESDFSCI